MGIGALVLATVAFVGTHFAMSHPLRRPLVRAMGEKVFMAFYSLVALATLAAVAVTFKRAPVEPLLYDGSAAWAWVVSSLLTYLAMALFLASLTGNPAMPGARVAGLSAVMPRGVYRLTRHPMMAAFAIWAISHVVIMPNAASLVLCGGIFVLAVVGAHLQDRKKDVQFGKDWRAWIKRTPFWPSPARFGKLGWYWGLALFPWLVVTWLHLPAAGVPAGVWALIPSSAY